MDPGFVLVFWIVGIAVWFGLASVTGSVCSQKGHDSTIGFLISLFCSPFLGFLYAAALPDRHREIEDAAHARRLMEHVPDLLAPGVSAGLDAFTAGASRQKVRCPTGCLTFLPPGTLCPICGKRIPG